MNKLFYPFLIVVALAVSGCASGPKFDTISAQIPNLKKNEGRIFFTRAAEYQGSAVQPNIKLNGEVVGVSKPGGFFYVDRAAGDYVVTIATEVENSVSFRLNAAETKYIKTSPSWGLLVGRITPTIENAEQGKSDVRSLSYTGN